MRGSGFKGGSTAPPPHGGAGSVRPRLHTGQHLRLNDKSAFPAQPAAFGPTDPGGPAFGPPPQAGMGGGPAGGGPQSGAAPGDMGE